MKTLSMTELYETSKNLSVNDLILDVRSAGEFAEGHVPTAANIPVDQVIGHAAELKKYQNIYLYCKMGGRAQMAYEILESMGLTNLVCVDEGGFPGWEKAGFPVEK